MVSWCNQCVQLSAMTSYSHEMELFPRMKGCGKLSTNAHVGDACTPSVAVAIVNRNTCTHGQGFVHVRAWS